MQVSKIPMPCLPDQESVLLVTFSSPLRHITTMNELLPFPKGSYLPVL